MRLSFALIVLGCLVAGCGDDTTSSTGGDMSMSLDLSGGGAAPTCSAYCAKIQMNCTAGDGGGNTQFADTQPRASAYCSTAAAWPAGMLNDVSGNSVGCRLYHAAAAAANPVLHCPHAGPTGGDTCGQYCENYCQLVAKNCTGSNAVYDDELHDQVHDVLDERLT